MESAFWISDWITSILSETLAPPMIATKGRLGSFNALPRWLNSDSIKSPAADSFTKCVMPSVEA